MDYETLLRETGAILQGHFLLASGLHSDTYFQCAKLFEHPDAAERVFDSMASLWEGERVQVVVGPALGGVIPSYSLARRLGARSAYLEKENGVFQLRRGFSLDAGERVLVVEDVVTTGGSALAVLERLRELKLRVIGVTCVIFRGEGNPFPCELRPLLRLRARTFAKESCPMCRGGVPIQKPGGLRS